MNSNIFSRFSIQEKIIFAKRLSILIKAGIPILDSLKMLKRQATSPVAVRILGSVVTDVENGQLLSASLGKFRNLFGDFALNIIHVGEMTGTLQENLNYLTEELGKKQELRRKVIGALVYPAFILTATIAMGALLTIFIFPKILPVFASFDFKLPLTTRMLIFISNTMIHYGFFMAIGLAGLGVLFWLSLKNQRARFIIDHSILRIPIFGKLSQSYHLANFCRTLGLLLKSQVRIVQAVEIAGNTVQNLAYQRELKIIAENLTKGGKMSTHLELHTRLFPPIVPQMITVGEMTGNLSETLLYVAELYENEIDTLTKNLSTTLEPVLMIFMGLIVGFIAISIITPIYEITQYLHP